MFSSSKLASMFILFGLSSLSGVAACITVSCLAQKFGKSSIFGRTISLLNCFAGGVFLATSILHLLPESRESLESALENLGSEIEYPLTELLMGTGLLAILILEHIAHACCASSETNRSYDDDKNTSVSYSKLNDTSDSPNMTTGNKIRVDDTFEDSSCFDDLTYHTYGTVDGSIDDTIAHPYKDLAAPPAKIHADIKFDQSEVIVIKSPTKLNMKETPTTKEALNDLQTSPDESVSKLRGVVLLLALSLHMIFDGLALGLLKSDSKVWELVLALSLHKVLVFFTIAIETLELLRSTKKTLVLICVLALVSPVGILIGESLNSDSEDSARDVASAVLQGLATGTFLFVTFFEILMKELSAGVHDLIKVFAVISGFAIIAGVKLAEHEEHE